MAVPEHQVFICFRGKDVRRGFLSFLKPELGRVCIKYFVDTKENRGEDINILFQRIQESQVVLIILSPNFMESSWCIKELITAMKCMGPRLKVIPVYYNVKVAEVKKWKVTCEKAKEAIGEEWEKLVKEALEALTTLTAIGYSDYKDDLKLTIKVAKKVKKTLTKILDRSGEELNTTRNGEFFGISQRLQKLQEKLGMEREPSKETRVIGVLGMAGIGKTTLAKKLFDEGKEKFQRRMFFDDVHKTLEAKQLTKKEKEELTKKEKEKLTEKGKEKLTEKEKEKLTEKKEVQLTEKEKEELTEKKRKEQLTELRATLLKKLLKKTDMKITEETTHEFVKTQLLEDNVFLVLDNVSSKEQLEYLLGDKNWIKQGSKVVIVTNDKSLVEDLVDDTYVVPGLNEREGLECFVHHACGDDHKVHEGNLMELSREFVEYAKGNPLALKILGGELRGRDEAHWKLRLNQLAQSPSKTIQDVLNVSYDGLSQQQKEAFLDVTCFFRSENHKFVSALVDSEPEKGSSEIKDLADKFLISVSDGRVDMHGLLYILGKKLASVEKKRLWNHIDIIKVLKKKPGNIRVSDIRGMFLDMSEVGSDTSLSEEAFDGMDSLQYLKIYNSGFPQADYELNFSDGLKLPLQNIRYLYWLRFPEEELPEYFNPKNLIDLKLPYSRIKRLWNGVKGTENLKWVDLNHSVHLSDLSGLLGAQNLQRLNLEGCTKLTSLHEGMQNLKSLVYLNLRGCINLVILAEMNMESLKTLILSDCSNLEDFQVISEQLEALHLDGTALKGLPPSIIKLQKLVLLNLKDCKMLATVPDCLGNMEPLQEVILSGCSKLKSYPDLQENMRRLRVFLLDGTSIKEVPKLLQNPGLKGFPLLSHLCLRGNDKIKSLQPHIGDLYHLKSIDLKYCKNLESVPTLPPNLQRLDAHGCESLTKVGNPLAHLALTDQIHSTFIFSNCHKLDEVAKTGIISYTQKKSQLMSNALDRYNMGSVTESSAGACFPGCEMPGWLSHQTYGSVIVLPEVLSRHWSNNGTIGVALCAVVSFTDYQDQNHCFFVKCTSEFKNADGSLRQFSCMVGGNEPQMIKSDHVFIRYTSWLPSNDYYLASLRFEVTDGAGEVVKTCQVLKCGFSLVDKSDETEYVSWEVNSNPTDQRMDDNNTNDEEIKQQGETSSSDDNNNNNHDMSMFDTDNSTSSVDSEMENIHQQRETSYWATWREDLSDGNENSVKPKRKAADLIPVAAPPDHNGEASWDAKSEATSKKNDKNISEESLSPGSSEEGEVINVESPQKPGNEDAEEPGKDQTLTDGTKNLLDEESPEKEDSVQEREEPGNDQSLTDGVKNLFEILEKPIRLVCLVISIYTVATFVLRKR